MIQQVKDKIWKDESGRDVPVDYITLSLRMKERSAGRILNQSMKLNKELEAFKTEVSKLCNEVFEKSLKEMKVKSTADFKGNFTWFNFDRSIKIEVSISERIEFDDLTIQACKDKLDDFLDANIDSKAEFVKELVTDAFSTSRGSLDAKKVMSLLKYRTKIADPLFQDALNLLSDSIRRPDSKKYFRVWNRQEDGSYELIDLNFSSI